MMAPMIPLSNAPPKSAPSRSELPVFCMNPEAIPEANPTCAPLTKPVIPAAHCAEVMPSMPLNPVAAATPAAAPTPPASPPMAKYPNPFLNPFHPPPADLISSQCIATFAVPPIKAATPTIIQKNSPFSST